VVKECRHEFLMGEAEASFEIADNQVEWMSLSPDERVDKHEKRVDHLVIQRQGNNAFFLHRVLLS
jgi:hypothetical protein